MSLVLATLVLAAGVAIAQTTNATCSSSFDWSLNSLKQSPCLVAAYLGSACDNGLGFQVPALQNSLDFYEGPTVAQANPCACSSVFYSLLSACADCQSAQLITLARFSANCTTVYSQVFDQNIPPETAVPHWAYQDVTAQTDDKFNLTLAQLQVNAPESTANPQPTTTNTPSVSASPSPSPKKSNAGAIAGGVVGGVVLLALSCIAAFWFIRRRHRGVAPSSTVAGFRSASEFTPFSSTIQTPKLYDPSDPSTFPPSLSSGRVQSPAYSGNTLEQPRSRYTGAPEV